MELDVASVKLKLKLRSDVLIGVVVLWCASGLIALDMSQLFPSAISPFLLKISSEITWSTIGTLMAAPFAAHLTGMSVHKTYQLWQPFHGGISFVIAQMTGWTLVTGGIFFVGLEIFHELTGTRKPGILIGVALLSVAGNCFLLASLHLYKNSSESPAGNIRKWKVLGVLLTLFPLLSIVLLASFTTGKATRRSSDRDRLRRLSIDVRGTFNSTRPDVSQNNSYVGNLVGALFQRLPVSAPKDNLMNQVCIGRVCLLLEH